MAEIYAILCKGYVLCSSAEFYNQGLLLHARLLDADLVTQMIDRFQIAVERSDLRLTSEHVVRMVSTIAMHLHRGLAYNACREILTDILHDRRPVDTFLPESRLDANRRGYMYCTRDRCFAKK